MSTIRAIIHKLIDLDLDKNIIGYVKDSEGNYTKIIFADTFVDYEDNTNEIGMIFKYEKD